MFYKYCIFCGDIMFRRKFSEAKRENWLYCSATCKTKHRNKKYPTVVPKEFITSKNCLECDKIFSGSIRNYKFNKQKFCCKKCGLVYWSKHYTEEQKRIFYKKLSDIKKGKTVYIPNEEQRRAISERLKGSKSHFWKGGKTKESKIIRSSVDYHIWRENVFKRDNWTCVWCGARSQKGKAVILHSDHIKPFAYFPELRFELSNGRTLCRNCHKKTDTYFNKISKKGIIKE